MTQVLESHSSPLALLHAGFDGQPFAAVEPPNLTQLWRIGRWLRTQGARRPMSLRVVNGGTAIVDGRILACDDFGAIQDLSTTRRAIGAPSPVRKYR
jgi:hypothetical protein